MKSIIKSWFCQNIHQTRHFVNFENVFGFGLSYNFILSVLCHWNTDDPSFSINFQAPPLNNCNSKRSFEPTKKNSILTLFVHSTQRCHSHHHVQLPLLRELPHVPVWLAAKPYKIWRLIRLEVSKIWPKRWRACRCTKFLKILTSNDRWMSRERNLKIFIILSLGYNCRPEGSTIVFSREIVKMANSSKA